MSYCSENFVEPTARIQDVCDFVLLLGYKGCGTLMDNELGTFHEFFWFDEADYRSWSGVELSVHHNAERQVVVSTRTPISRSYFDLVHQNNTISQLRKRFGGTFRTDEGSGRYMRPQSGPPPAPASGCYLAFGRLGLNLIKAKICHEGRVFANHPNRVCKGMPSFVQEMDPRTLANNTLIPFLVAAMEDYFKSTFVALLRYSPRKEAFFKGVRLQGDQLVNVSDGKATVEDQLAETLSFQRISAVCRHFESLDSKLDIAGALRKPYRRRSESLYDSLDSIVLSRHNFIHRAMLDPNMTDHKISELFYDLDVALTRVYRRITDHYGWFFDRGWSFGRPPRKNSLNVSTMTQPS